MSEKVNLICKFCNKPFICSPWEREKKKFCSLACYSAYKKTPAYREQVGPIIKKNHAPCTGKDNGFYGKNHSEEDRQQASLLRRGKPSPHKAKNCSCKFCTGAKGSLNPNWHGGISKLPYSSDFTEELKDKVRRRQGYKCILCGKSEEENGRKLDIHHSHYCKSNSSDLFLVGLCKSCHSKTNYNRDSWKELFKQIAFDLSLNG